MENGIEKYVENETDSEKLDEGVVWMRDKILYGIFKGVL